LGYLRKIEHAPISKQAQGGGQNETEIVLPQAGWKNMIKYLILSCSIIALVVGYIYLNSEGLIVSIEENGAINYSNTFYKSSGSDEGFNLAIGFMTFILSAIFSISNTFNLVSEKTLKITYSINYIVFISILFLVSLDVSVVNSIKLGDSTLLFGLLITTVPFIFFISK
jgi:hypothetical protein